MALNQRQVQLWLEMQEEYPTVKLIRETRMISSGRRRCGNHLVPKGEAFTETVALVDGQMTTDILCDRCRYDYMP